MKANGREKRKFFRTVFTPETALQGRLIFPGVVPFSIRANITNLSLGGFHFALQRNANLLVNEGDHLTLVEFESIPQLNGVRKIKAEIKWLLDHRFFDHIGGGCQFVEIRSEDHDRIRAFLEKLSAV